MRCPTRSAAKRNGFSNSCMKANHVMVVFPRRYWRKRMDFLRRAILAIWEEPEDQNRVCALHRLMWYYADMAHKRREADRQSKQRSQCDPPTSHYGVCTVDQATEDDDPNMGDTAAEDGRHDSCNNYGGSVPFLDNIHSPPAAEDSPFAQVASYIRELFGIECDAYCAYWDYKLEDESEDSVTIKICCECGQVAREMCIAKDDFKTYGEAILWSEESHDES